MKTDNKLVASFTAALTANGAYRAAENLNEVGLHGCTVSR
jgi:hypothetical protein